MNATDYDSDVYDTEAIAADERNGNFSPESLEDYRHEAIVLASLGNGQRTQARQQVKAYGLRASDVVSYARELGRSSEDCLEIVSALEA